MMVVPNYPTPNLSGGTLIGQDRTNRAVSRVESKAESSNAGEASSQEENSLELLRPPPPDHRGPALNAVPPVRIRWNWKSPTRPQDPRLLVPNYGQNSESEELRPSAEDACTTSRVKDPYAAAYGENGGCVEDHERVLVRRDEEEQEEERRRSGTTRKDVEVDQVLL